MKLWKCWNCPDAKQPMKPGYDFVAERPVCPLCGTDGELPENKNEIVPRVVLHFDPPASDRPSSRGKGKGICACSGKKLIAGGFRGTGETAQVTCPACQQTRAFIEAQAAEDVDPMYDVPMHDVPVG